MLNASSEINKGRLHSMSKMKQGPDYKSEPCILVSVVNDGLGSSTVIVVFLDYRRSV